MADINKLAPKILKWEGGYGNFAEDKGGPTKFGITLATWQQMGEDKDGDGDIDAEDIKVLNASDFTLVFKRFWDKWQADKINNQSIADFLVDWYYNSGKWGIKIPQRVLGVSQDGVVGSETIKAINSSDPEELFAELWGARKEFLLNIVKNNPSQKKFIKGWLNRINDFSFSH